jgi:hypothetical protein
MESEDGHSPQSSSPASISLPTLRRVNPEFAERQSSIPRVGDVWIPRSEISPNHFIRLHVPDVEDLFAKGDRLVRIEHSKEAASDFVHSFFFCRS